MRLFQFGRRGGKPGLVKTTVAEAWVNVEVGAGLRLKCFRNIKNYTAAAARAKVEGNFGISALHTAREMANAKAKQFSRTTANLVRRAGLNLPNECGKPREGCTFARPSDRPRCCCCCEIRNTGKMEGNAMERVGQSHDCASHVCAFETRKTVYTC